MSAQTPTVAAVSCNDVYSFTKPVRAEITLVAGLGVEGDVHAGVKVRHRSRVKADPAQPNLRQVHLIQGELFDEVRRQGYTVAPGNLGENVTTNGIDLLGLPRGTILRFGPPPDAGGSGPAPDAGGSGPAPKAGGFRAAPEAGGFRVALAGGGSGAAPKAGGSGAVPKAGGSGAAPEAGGFGSALAARASGPAPAAAGYANGAEGFGPPRGADGSGATAEGFESPPGADGGVVSPDGGVVSPDGGVVSPRSATEAVAGVLAAAETASLNDRTANAVEALAAAARRDSSGAGAGDQRTAVVITGLRNPCAQINGFRSGLLKQVLEQDAEGNVLRKAGVMGVVLRGGRIRAGDQVTVELPPRPHLPLECI
jgi:MOSC domain-containing protein YiiM